MINSTTACRNPLCPENQGRRSLIEELEGMDEELILGIDPIAGEYTGPIRLRPGADTSKSGGKTHGYLEEIFAVSGRLSDHAFGLWLEAGRYARRPPGEHHGPCKTDAGCVVLEVSFPDHSVDAKEAKQAGEKLIALSLQGAGVGGVFHPPVNRAVDTGSDKCCTFVVPPN